MSVILIILGLPAQFYVLYKNTTYTMVPYSWSRVHGSSWWDIVLIPSHGTVLFDHWIQLAVCTTIFAFFGLGQDAMKMYRRWFLTIGFDKLFPSLNPTTPTASASSSYSSRAQMFLKEKFSRGSNYTTSRFVSALNTTNTPNLVKLTTKKSHWERLHSLTTIRPYRFLDGESPPSHHCSACP